MGEARLYQWNRHRRGGAQAREQFLAMVGALRPELHRYCARLTGHEKLAMRLSVVVLDPAGSRW